MSDAAMMSARWPWSSLAVDYVRAMFGLAFTVVPLVELPLHSVVDFLLILMAGVFTLFLLRTIGRHMSVISWDGITIERRGLSRTSIAWAKVDRVTLAYFSTRRDRRNGWLDLRISGDGHTLRLDSMLPGFTTICEHVAARLLDGGLEVDESTLGNLAALGLIVLPASAVVQSDKALSPTVSRVNLS